MKSIGIFYGSSLGTTADVANKIAEKLNVGADNVFDVAETPADKVKDFECILLGSSTWGLGELQDDWISFIDSLKEQELSDKLVGLFGCGDAEGYPDTFCDALGVIYDELSSSGCKFIGAYAPEGYSTTESLVNRDGKFIGLAIDDTNESDKSDDRLNTWLDEIKKEL